MCDNGYIGSKNLCELKLCKFIPSHLCALYKPTDCHLLCVTIVCRWIRLRENWKRIFTQRCRGALWSWRHLQHRCLDLFTYLFPEGCLLVRRAANDCGRSTFGDRTTKYRRPWPNPWNKVCSGFIIQSWRGNLAEVRWLTIDLRHNHPSRHVYYTVSQKRDTIL